MIPFLLKFISICAIFSLAFSTCGKYKSLASTNDLLIIGGTIVTMASSDKQVIENGALLICDGIIKFVGTEAQYKSEKKTRTDFCPDPPLQTIHPYDVVVPAFINAHTHGAMSLFKNLGNDRPLADWLNNYIFPLEGALVDEKFCRIGTKLAMAEHLASGTSTFADMYFFQDAVAEEVSAVGMRAFLGESVIDFSQPDSPTPNNTLENIAEPFLKKWSNHPLIEPCITPHAPYTTSAWVYKEAIRLNRKYNKRTWTHCSETSAEDANTRAHQGMPSDSNMTVTEFLNSIGALGSDVTCAHSVWLTDKDVEIYRSTGTKIAHCPSANLKLASGVMGYPALKRAGIKIGMGTDGQSSNNDVDIIGEAHLASMLHKGVNLNAESAPALDVLKHLTIDGAAVLEREDKQGSLEVGKMGDVTVFRGDSVKWTPRFDIGINGTKDPGDTAALIIYNSNAFDVKGTVVSGKVLYWNGCYTTMDIEKVKKDAVVLSQEIRNHLQQNNADISTCEGADSCASS